MRRWQRLRAAILEEGRRSSRRGLELRRTSSISAGPISNPASPSREAAAAGRERLARAAALDLPLTASRDEIEAAVIRVEHIPSQGRGPADLPGISLGPAVVEGRAVKADDLVSLLGRPETWGRTPSWSFPPWSPPGPSSSPGRRSRGRDRRRAEPRLDPPPRSRPPRDRQLRGDLQGDRVGGPAEVGWGAGGGGGGGGLAYYCRHRMPRALDLL